jgi:cytoskeletal protein RodZ
MENENRSSMMMLVIVLLAVIIFIAALFFILRDDELQDNNNNTEDTTEENNTTDDTDDTDEKPVITETKTFELTEQNDSGQNGTVTLDEVGDQVQVTIALSNPTATPEPAHIHVGSCPTPGVVVFPLENVVNGASVTLLDTSFDDLKSQGDLAVNVHKSATESSVYFACGNLEF